MISTTFDAVARRAAESVSRRASLLTLGGAALAATAAAPGVSLAKKGKKCGKKTKKQEQKRCKRDAAACRKAIQCEGEEPSPCIRLRACCETCSAGGFAECYNEVIAGSSA